MSSGYTSENVLKSTTAGTVGASATNQELTKPFFNAHWDSLYQVIDVHVTASTVAVGITAKLQDSQDGINWFDKKTVAITAVVTETAFTIKLLPDVAGDQTYLPLRPIGRVVITSGAGDSATVSKIMRTERL